MKEVKKQGKFRFVIRVLFVLFILAFIFSKVVGIFSAKPYGNVAVIHLDGIIMVGGSSDLFGSPISSSTQIIAFIEEADEDPNIKAILLEINSPGGSAVASKEIVDALQRTNKSTYSLIREIGTSGAYWSASATDKIVANDLSIVGSIGVTSSYIEFAGLLERYNITYQRLVSGKYKDTGTPYRPLEKEEKDLLQDKINTIHDYFVASVAANRDLPLEKVEILATGEFFLGIEALENGLVDALGDKETVRKIIQEDLELEEVIFAEFSAPETLVDILFGAFSKQSFFLGKGFGSNFLQENAPLSLRT